MRVIEPTANGSNKTGTSKSAKSTRKRLLIVIFALLIIGVTVWFTLHGTATSPEAPTNREQNNAKANGAQKAEKTEVKPKKLKTFTGQQFKDLYESISYPNVQEITGLVTITGNTTADARIVQIAETRGYKKRSVPNAPIQKIGNTYPDGDDLLQPLAIAGWQVLRDNALAAGLNIRILSAYRSPELQRAIFTNRLYATGVTPESIAAGQSDAAVNQILVTSSIPGYSRHHTGYTIDLQCDGGTLEAFVNTPCYAWMSANNFEQAKVAGWIPSYPEGAAAQGPEPEPWEFVWVGTDVLYE